MLAVAQNNIHPEVAQWISKAKANGGVYSSQTINALNLLVTDIKRYGLRNKIYRLNMFVGENSNAGAVPIIADRGNSIDTIVGSPLYTPSGGFNQNNNSAANYIKTGLTVTAGDAASLHQGNWNFTGWSGLYTSQQGIATAGGNRFAFHYPWNEGIVYSDMYGATPGTSRSQTNSFTSGTILQNIICTVNASVNRIYRNGSLVTLSSTGTGAGTIPTGSEYFILTSSSATNTPNGSMNNIYRIGYYTVGAGLTANECFLYNKAVTDFMNRLGRS